MKKIYFLAASLLLSAGAMAQTNLDFETWAPGATGQSTDPHPGNWSSPLVGPGYIDNDIPTVVATPGCITIQGVVAGPTTQETAAPSQGTSNVGLQTFTISGLAGPLAGFNGIHGSQVEQVIPTTVKTTQISFEFKSANLAGNDTALVFIEATGPSGGLGANGDIIAQGVYEIIGDQATWTLDTVDITYFTGAAIDTITIRFTSSASSVFTSYATPAADGGMIEIDDVIFIVPPVPADPATNIIASDVSNNHNGTDLQVTFDAAADETTVAEYRVFALGYGLVAPASTLASIPSGMDLYVSVTPDGSASYTATFTAASKVLTTAAPYTIVEDSLMDIFVLSIADGTNATADQVAGPDSTVLMSDSVTGIVNLSMQANTIRVYPNPARNFVNIAFQNSDMANVVNIYSMTGQLMKSVPATIVTKIDLSTFDSGMYFFRILDDNKQIIKTDKFQVVK